MRYCVNCPQKARNPTACYTKLLYLHCILYKKRTKNTLQTAWFPLNCKGPVPCGETAGFFAVPFLADADGMRPSPGCMPSASAASHAISVCLRLCAGRTVRPVPQAGSFPANRAMPPDLPTMDRNRPATAAHASAPMDACAAFAVRRFRSCPERLQNA